MTTALVSLLTGRPVKHTVGMTGEVTLQGRVLPIGGLKQKVLAAHAAGLTDVVIPERNRADLEDVPEEVREAMRFHPVLSIDEVLRAGARAGGGPGAQRLVVDDETDRASRGTWKSALPALARPACLHKQQLRAILSEARGT